MNEKKTAGYISGENGGVSEGEMITTQNDVVRFITNVLLMSQLIAPTNDGTGNYFNPALSTAKNADIVAKMAANALEGFMAYMEEVGLEVKDGRVRVNFEEVQAYTQKKQQEQANPNAVN